MLRLKFTLVDFSRIHKLNFGKLLVNYFLGADCFSGSLSELEACNKERKCPIETSRHKLLVGKKASNKD